MRVQAIAVLLVAAALGLAQHGSTPAIRVDQSTEGARLFRAQCAGCHGIDGSGTGAAPAVNTGRFRHGSSDQAIVTTISKGVAGTVMPAFSFDALQMPQIVAFVRSLAIVRAVTDVKGDVARGKVLFQSNCAGCHTTAGSYTGPDLTEVAARLTAAELRKSILEPDAVVSSEYWSVVAHTHSGQLVEGIRLNEDTTSIQLRDRAGKLSSALKTDLRDFEIVRKSPMPSFDGKLAQQQVDDLVAYLVRGQQ